jgi:hypothetical protein
VIHRNVLEINDLLGPKNSPGHNDLDFESHRFFRLKMKWALRTRTGVNPSVLEQDRRRARSGQDLCAVGFRFESDSPTSTFTLSQTAK